MGSKKQNKKPIDIHYNSIILKNTKQPLEFHSICIEADSHGRHLAGLMEELLPSGTRVSAVVKPGAGLLNVVSTASPAPGGCAIIMAGTNDLAIGEENLVYQHLEDRIANKLTTSRVVVCTLPHRHDLQPNHPINKQTWLMNKHITKLTDKYDGAELVDFNKIPRRLFTSHGMHLRMPGKRLLASLLVDCLLGLGSASSNPESQPARNISVAASADVVSSPIQGCLQLNTYAEVVKSPSNATAFSQVTPSHHCDTAPLSPVVELSPADSADTSDVFLSQQLLTPTS